MGISTHILDTTRGKPAAGVSIRLERREGEGFRLLGTGVTDADGRVKALLPDGALPEAGDHRLTFEIGPYFTALGVTSFYPSVQIEFTVRAPAEHHHVPLLLNPFGYATYRGS